MRGIVHHELGQAAQCFASKTAHPSRSVRIKFVSGYRMHRSIREVSEVCRSGSAEYSSTQQPAAPKSRLVLKNCQTYRIQIQELVKGGTDIANPVCRQRDRPGSPHG